MSKTLNDYFDHIYCINLSKRKDRWEQANLEFKKHNIEVERISGIDGKQIDLSNIKYSKHAEPYFSPGTAGCAMSFVSIFRDAKEKGYKTFLVLEDDVEFVDNFNQLFFQYLEQVPANWKLLYTSGNHRGKQYIKSVSENVIQVKNTLCAHFLGINAEILDDVINETSKYKMPCDWHLAEIQRRHPAYCIIPPLTWQREGYSDNEDKHMNYDQYLKTFNIRNDFNMRY
jgi:GR25 family glycosyltransferase involved in LPS biosynthesis